MRPEVEEIFQFFAFANGDDKKFAKVHQSFDMHFVPKENVIH